MKLLTLLVLCVLTLPVFSQAEKVDFLEIIVEGRDAYMNAKNGEVIFREHSKTNPEAFIVDAEGNTFYVDTQIHPVSKGETLSSIAKKHKTSIDRIKKDNNISKSDLSIGQEIKINTTQTVEILKPTVTGGEGRIVARLAPGQNPNQLNAPPPRDEASTQAYRAPKTSTQSDTVLKETKETSQEVVSEIVDAKESATTTAEKQSEKAEENANTYIVKKGDTLFGIAKKHNMTVQELKKMNDLMLSNLSIGQKLKVK